MPKTFSLEDNPELQEFSGSKIITVPPAWEVDSATVLRDDRFIALVSVEYKVPGTDKLDQKTLTLRKYAPAVAVFKRTPQGVALLVVKQLRHGAGKETTELPGGMPKGNEPDAAVAAREGSEEGGITLKETDLVLVATLDRDPARSVNLTVPLFFAEITDDTPSMIPFVEDGEFITGRQWALVSDLVTQALKGEVSDPIVLSALFIWQSLEAAGQ